MVQFAYTINQGVAPTLLYPVPSPSDSPILSTVITSLRDYYPLWQVCINALRFTTVFPIFFWSSSTRPSDLYLDPRSRSVYRHYPRSSYLFQLFYSRSFF